MHLVNIKGLYAHNVHSRSLQWKEKDIAYLERAVNNARVFFPGPNLPSSFAARPPPILTTSSGPKWRLPAETILLEKDYSQNWHETPPSWWIPRQSSTPGLFSPTFLPLDAIKSSPWAHLRVNAQRRCQQTLRRPSYRRVCYRYPIPSRVCSGDASILWLDSKMLPSMCHARENDLDDSPNHK